MLIAINLIMTVVMVVLIGVILRLPDYIVKTWLEQTKNKNAHEIQIESYFKQLGGKQQQEILSVWTDFLTDMDNTAEKYSNNSPDGISKFKQLIHNTVVYGSDRTVKLLSAYSHFVYSGDSDGNKMIVYVAFIVSSLKEDFSGYEISPLTLLKLMIKDYDDYKVAYKKCAKEIEEEVGDNSHVWNNSN
jgi:hypothetical protein|nr:hypothetical protein [Limosilactobacillus mucosae]